jgi:hypothetical protein
MGEGDEEPREEGDEAAEKAGEGEPARRRRADADPDDPLVHAQTPVASLDELRSALAWAFESEAEHRPPCSTVSPRTPASCSRATAS